MHRRALLAATATTLAGLAGCNSTTDDSPKTTPTTTPDTPTPTDAPSTPAGSLQVELEQVPYGAMAYRLSHGRGINPEDIVPVEEVQSPLRSAFREAVDGGYETDSVSEDFRAAIDEFRTFNRTSIDPYVRIDGIAYEFDAEVPTFVAWLADEEADDPDPETVVGEDERRFESEEVDSFVRALRAHGTHVVRSEYRTCVVLSAVQAFLDQYDYVADQRGTSPIRTERRHTDPPHRIDMRELTEEDVWGRPVVEEADLDPAARSFIRTVIDSDHRAPSLMPNRSMYFADDVPSAALELRERSDEARYYRIDGEVYGFGVGSPDYESIPIAVTVEEQQATDPDEQPAFTLTATPDVDAADGPVDRDGTFTFTAEGGLPSVLWVTHDGERFRLPSEAYERDKWRTVDDAPTDEPRPVNEVLEVRDHGDPVVATYRIPDRVPPGTYVSRGMFRISWSIPDQTPGDYGSYPFRLRISHGSA